MDDVYGVGKWDHTTKIKISHAVPTLKLVPSKGDHTGLGYKAKYQIRLKRQEHRPNQLFLPNSPTNPFPKVSVKSKKNYSTKPMKSHTFGVRRPTFKHTFITDGRESTWLAQVEEKMAHRAI